MKYILSTTFIILITCLAISQEGTNRNELKVTIGLSHTTITDARISALPQKAWSPKYGMSYRKMNDKRISQIDIDFTYASNSSGSLLSLNSIMPKANYSYLRKTPNGVWLGGFIDHTTLLNLPKSRTGLFNNNPISYMLSASLGPMVSYEKSGILNNERISLRANAQLPILAYVIQPEHGHPYPKQYLEEDTFTPMRGGLTGPLLKSGRVVTINKYRSLNVSFSLQYALNDKVELSLNFNSQLLYANTTGKSVSLTDNSIELGASYIH